MKNITTRQFSVLGDCGRIYQFMLDISYSYKNRIWEDNGEIVAFCFYESPITDIYFSLKPGYEELAAAALSELYRKMKALGATHMTGGMNPFYKKIGYKPAEKWTYWKKH